LYVLDSRFAIAFSKLKRKWLNHEKDRADCFLKTKMAPDFSWQRVLLVALSGRLR